MTSLFFVKLKSDDIGVSRQHLRDKTCLE